jgi:DNA-binding NarL/FixJ family response regulator
VTSRWSGRRWTGCRNAPGRARREQAATARTARKRTIPAAGAGELLTAQEAQVAPLARDGLSNPEIGAGGGSFLWSDVEIHVTFT